MHRQTRPILLLVAILIAAALGAGCSRQARKARHQQRADHYFDAGQYPQAEVEYLNTLRLDRADSRAISRLGIIYYDNGRLTRAYSYLSKAAELEPTNAAVRLRAGYLHLLEGKWREARADAEAARECGPNDEDAVLLLVQTFRTAAEIKDGRARFEKEARSNERSAPLQVGLGATRLRENDRAGAAEALQRALEINPRSSAAHAMWGALYLADNDAANAEVQLKAAAELAPVRSARRLEYAEFKWRTGNASEAQRLLAEMTQTIPDYLPAGIKLAQIDLDLKQFDLCESLLQQTLGRDPDNYDALSLRGALRLAKGETDKAIAELERLNNLYIRSPQARFNLALAYYSKGETAKAYKCAADAAAINPNFDEAVLLQAQLDLQRDHTNAAISSLTQLIQRRPQLAQAYLLLAQAYVGSADLEAALAAYHRLAELYPQNPQAPLLIGQVFALQGKRSDARKAYEESLRLAPDNLLAVEQLVNLDLSDGQTNAAMARIQAELDKTPSRPELQVLLARVYNFQRDLDRAENALKKAVELDVNYEPAYHLLAKLYADTKKHAEALARLNEMVAKNPRDIESLMLMGMVLNDQENFTAAREAYEKLLAIAPNFSPALNNLAYLYSEKFNLLNKAYEAARKARELKPYDPYAADTLGWILYRRGELTWALGLLQESAQKLPQEPEIQFHLGMTCYQLDDEPLARKYLEMAAAATNNFPGKEEAARRLALLAIDPLNVSPATQSLLEARLKDQPDDPVALGRLASVFQQRNAPQQAAAAYEQALKQNPKNPRLMIRLARLYSDPLHDSAKALALCKDAYKLAPDDPDVTRALGELAFAAGDFKWAASLLEQTSQKKIADPELEYGLALAYYSIGRVNDAASAANDAVQSDDPFPRKAQASRFLEMIDLAADPAKAAAAESQLKLAGQTDPADVPTLMALGAAAEQRGDAARAGQIYEQALKRYPDFVPAMRQLAILFADQDGREQSIYPLAAKAREALPNDPELAKALGMLCYRRGDFRAAARLLGTDSAAGTADARAQYYLGMAHYRLKNFKDAKAALQRALQLNLASPAAEEARRIVSELK